MHVPVDSCIFLSVHVGSAGTHVLGDLAVGGCFWCVPPCPATCPWLPLPEGAPAHVWPGHACASIRGLPAPVWIKCSLAQLHGSFLKGKQLCVFSNLTSHKGHPEEKGPQETGMPLGWFPRLDTRKSSLSHGINHSLVSRSAPRLVLSWVTGVPVCTRGPLPRWKGAHQQTAMTEDGGPESGVQGEEVLAKQEVRCLWSSGNGTCLGLWGVG